MKEVYERKVSPLVIHAQTGTRFQHRSIWLNSIVFNQHGKTLLSFMLFTTLNAMQSVWNPLTPIWQTLSIMFLYQYVWKVVYVV